MARIVLNGANRGIGLEMARQLAARGDEVIAVCRQSSPALEALEVEIHAGIDVSEDGAPERFAAQMAGRPVDMLINVAGILIGDTLDSFDWEDLRRQFEVNTLGPLRMVRACHGLMRESGKIGLVSSRVGSLADNSSGGNYGYRMSKTAVNIAGVNLAHDLKPRGIAVFLLHPGYVRTEMTGGRGYIEADEAARGLIERLDTLTLAETGTFWHADGSPLPW